METKRAKKRRPTHPGEVLREDVLPVLGLTQLEFANRLGVSRAPYPSCCTNVVQ